jgi:hypothetical protein
MTRPFRVLTDAIARINGSLLVQGPAAPMQAFMRGQVAHVDLDEWDPFVLRNTVNAG